MAGYALGAFQETLVTVWRTPATIEALRELREREARLVKASPRGITIVTVMEPGSFSQPLGAHERAEATAIAREFGDKTLASAYIFEGEGFRAAMARAVVSGIMLLSRAGYPNKVFSTVKEGLKWLHPRLGANGDPFSLEQFIEELRAQIT